MKRKSFYRNYGKHIFLIEIVLIIVLASFSLAYLSLAYVASRYLSSITTLVAFALLFFFILAFFAHVIIYTRIARLELYPYETLRLERFNSRFYRALLLSSLVAFAWLFLIGRLYHASSLSGALAVGVEIIAIWAVASIAMLFGSFPISMSSLMGHNKARLSFRASLVGLKLVCKEQTKEKRSKLVKNYIKWFKEGLRSYNSFLYKFKPVHIEVVNIDSYYRSICCASLIGNQTERDIVMEEIRRALDSMGGRFREEDFRQLLVALRNIRNVQRNNESQLSELNDLMRVLSFSERVKRMLKSPYFEAIIAALEIIIAVLVYYFR